MKSLAESIASEKLSQLIQKKKRYFEKPKPDFAQKELQSEILLLENEILPIVLEETTVLFSEMTKYLNLKIGEAVKQDANAIVVIIHLRDSKDNTLRIATVNPYKKNPSEGIEVDIYANYRQITEIQL